jgi:hypothetical protein
MTRYSGFSQWWWDKILDGNVYRLVRDGLPAGMSLLALRSRVYKEADARDLIVQTHWPRDLEAALYIQAAPAGKTSQLVYLSGLPEALPMPALDIPNPALVATFPTLEEEDALLGPCTCGQAPRCLPSCARVN